MPSPTRIALYTSRNCAKYQVAKALLQQYRVPIRKAQVDQQPQTWAELQRLGRHGVPVMLIGERRIDGDAPREIRQTLRAAGFQLS